MCQTKRPPVVHACMQQQAHPQRQRMLTHLWCVCCSVKALKMWTGRGARELLESVVAKFKHNFAVHSVVHGIAAELLRKQQLVLAAR